MKNGDKSMHERPLSYATCVERVLSTSNRPLPVATLMERVAGFRPVGKGGQSAVFRALNTLFQAVPVGQDRYGWLSNLLGNTTFRHPLTAEEVCRGYLLLDELEHIIFFPQFFQSYRPDDRTVQIELFGGPTITAQASIERKTWCLNLGQAFAEWIDEHGGQDRDDILISVIDATVGKYQLRLNLREMRDGRVLHRRNIEMALIAEEIVAEDATLRPAMPTWELAARLIARGYFDQSPPPDDLHSVLHEFSLLHFGEGFGYRLVAEKSMEDRNRRDLATQKVGNSGDALANNSHSRLGGVKPMNRWNGDGIGPEGGATDPNDADACPDYEQYLADFRAEHGVKTKPLSHEDYHLLEAELEMLVHLEDEFGKLINEQERRKVELSQRLYIDPESFLDTDDWDLPDDADYGDPPFWVN